MLNSEYVSSCLLYQERPYVIGRCLFAPGCYSWFVMVNNKAFREVKQRVLLQLSGYSWNSKCLSWHVEFEDCSNCHRVVII